MPDSVSMTIAHVAAITAGGQSYNNTHERPIDHGEVRNIRQADIAPALPLATVTAPSKQAPQATTSLLDNTEIFGLQLLPTAGVIFDDVRSTSEEDQSAWRTSFSSTALVHERIPPSDYTGGNAVRTTTTNADSVLHSVPIQEPRIGLSPIAPEAKVDSSDGVKRKARRGMPCPVCRVVFPSVSKVRNVTCASICSVHSIHLAACSPQCCSQQGAQFPLRALRKAIHAESEHDASCP